MKRKAENRATPPSSALPFFEGGRIEIREVGEEKELLILGVNRILRFGEEEMAFSRRRDEVHIVGRRLNCVSYASGAIGLRGQLESLTFRRKGESV